MEQKETSETRISSTKSNIYSAVSPWAWQYMELRGNLMTPKHEVKLAFNNNANVV